jgi:Co/Zn/Cd efflux system component
MADSCCGSPKHEHGHKHDHKQAHAHDHAQDHGHKHEHKPAGKAGEVDLCCQADVRFDGMDARYKLILWIVIAINGAMFLVEMAAGRIAGSQALQADALDFLGDTLTYGISLAVIGAALHVRAWAAFAKGISLSAMGLFVFGSTAYQVLVLGVPSAGIMGTIGFMALAANLVSVALLAPYKDGDANVRSVWLCSRNDAISNVIVMFAALGVWGSASAWPDLAVAAIMAGLFLWSSVSILRQASAELRVQRLAPAE